MPESRKMPTMTLGRNQTPSLSSLPDELLLLILEHLHPHDLWYMSQTSKRFSEIPEEMLMRKFFQQYPVRLSWCCTYCLIQSFPAPVLDNLVPLFDSSKFEVVERESLWLELKVFILDTTILTFFPKRESQRCVFDIGSRSLHLRMKDLHEIRQGQPGTIQTRRRQFLKFFYSELSKTKKRSPAKSLFLWAKHRFAPFPEMFAGATLILAAAMLIFGYCTVFALLDLAGMPLRILQYCLGKSRWWRRRKGDVNSTP